MNSLQQTHGTSALKYAPDYRDIDRRYKQARDYLELGLTAVPVPNGQKHPNYKWGAFKGLDLPALYDDTEQLTKRLRGQGRDMLRQFYSVHNGLAVITGKPSDDTFVIDCDTEQSALFVLRALSVRGIDAPYVETARGKHIYLKSGNGTIESIASGRIPDIEIKSNGDLAILPPTIHPTGIQYKWANGMPSEIPRIDTDYIDFLTDKNGQSVQLKPVTSERYFHADTLDYLANGHKLTEGTRNNRLYRASGDFRYIGKALHETERILAPIAIASGLLSNEVLATIRSAFNGKRSDTKKQNSTQSKIWAYAQSISFDSVKQVTGLAMIEALLCRRGEDSHNRNNGIFRASYRELELKAKVSHRTAQKTLTCLINMGIIERAGNVDNNKRKACLWRFSDDCLSKADEYFKSSDHQKYHSSIYDTTTAVYCATFNSPLAERGSLGKRGYQVYSLLSERGEMTVKDIMAELSISEGSARYQLNKLKSLKLIAHDTPVYRAINNPFAVQRITAKGILREHKQQQRILAERALFQLGQIVPFILGMKPEQPVKTVQIASYGTPQDNSQQAPKSANSAIVATDEHYVSVSDDSVEFTPNIFDSDTLEAMYQDMSIADYASESIALDEDEI